METKSQSLFGGNSEPEWSEYLSELKPINDWPGAEKFLKELKFCKDELGKLTHAINREKSEIDFKHEHLTSKLDSQIHGLTQHLFDYFKREPVAIESHKPYLEQLNIEIEEIHKYKIKFKKGEKINAENKII
jgi:hypothetical protein